MSDERFQADISQIREFVSILEGGEATHSTALLVIENIIRQLDLLAEQNLFLLDEESGSRFLSLTAQIKNVLQGINTELFTKVRLEKAGDRYSLATDQLNQLSTILNLLHEVPQLISQL